MKKVLVVLLAMVMIFAFAATAMAADTQYVPYSDISDQDVEIQTAIERLTILGALKGYDEAGTKYAPAQLITREEWATVAVRIAGLEDAVALYGTMASNFTDVEEGRWSEGYVNCANQNGIMIGRGGGKFDPKSYVTMQEIATTLLRAVGYDDRLSGGNWPNQYNAKAVNVGLTEYIDYIGPKYATRGEAASMVNEAIELNLVYFIEDPTAAGMGQILGGSGNSDFVDADGYAFLTVKTNEGNATIDLLAKTFDAAVDPVIYPDYADAYSEGATWYFDDFDEWELMIEELEITLDSDGNIDTIEAVAYPVASLYGISGGQGLVDLAGQYGEVTYYIDADREDETVYVELLSTVSRTDNADADDHAVVDDCSLTDIFTAQSTALIDEAYGEFWACEDGDIYFTKDFEQFADDDFSIVESADEEDVIMNATPGAIDDIRLDDSQDEAFWLMGSGFVAGADLQKGDVIYNADFFTATGTTDDDVDFYIVFRAKTGVLDKLATTWVELDAYEYSDCNDFSFYSTDMMGSFNDYDFLGVEDLPWSTEVAYVPAYAFVNFVYFADAIDNDGIGILDHYIFDEAKSGYLATTAEDTVLGIAVLGADGTMTEYAFDQEFLVADMADADVEYDEGSLIEFTLNKDGEVVAIDQDTNAADNVRDFSFITAGHKFTAASCGATEYDSAAAEWLKNGKLNIAAGGNQETYKLAADAVIYVVESNGEDAYPEDPALYAFESAKVYSVDDFKAIGDFSAAMVCIYDADGTTANVIYVKDIEVDSDTAYGLGLYDGELIYSVSGEYYFATIGGETIKIDADIVDAPLQADLGSFSGLVAYTLTDGVVADAADIIFLDCAELTTMVAAETAGTDYVEFFEAYDYLIVHGALSEVVGGDTNEVVLTGEAALRGETNNSTYDLSSAAYVAGYDAIAGEEITLDDLEDIIDDTNESSTDSGAKDYDGKHVLLFVDEDENPNDVAYIVIYDACAI